MRIKFLLSCFLVVAFSLIKAQIPTNSLVSSWPFSGNANDVVGTNNGTVVGAALIPDRCGNPNSAYSFNGTSNYIITSALGPIGSAPRSVSFWARTSNTVINNPRVSFDYGLNSGNGDTFQVNWNYCGPGVGIDVSNQAMIRGNSCLLNNQWHHIVAIFDPAVSTAYSSTQFYFDGVLQPGIACNTSGTSAAMNTGTVFPITIGRGVTPVRYFLGDLDDFYLYNRAITAAEVLQLYNASPCQPPVFGNTLVCIGSTNIYSVSPYSNATYTWTLPGGWSGTSTSNTISVISGSNSGVITVAASSTCGTLPTSSLAVSIITSTLINVTSSNSVVCSGGTTTLSVSGAVTYTWLPNNVSNTSIVVSPTATTIYTIISSNSVCTSSSIYTLNISANPTISISGSPSVACRGNSLTLSAFGGASYTWQPGVATGSIVTVAPLSSIVYTVNGLTSGGCSGVATFTVAVPSTPTVTIAASSPTSCAGAAITLTANGSGGISPYTYTWAGGPTTATYVTARSPGTYIYTLSALDFNNCAATATISLSYFSSFTVTVPTNSVCPNTTGTLVASGASTYTWLPSGLTGNTFTAAPLITTTYSVVGRSAAGCTASSTGEIFIKPAPTLSLSTFTITCANLGSATVSALGGTGPFNYTWSPSNQTGAIATGLFPGSYTVQVADLGTGCVFSPTTNLPPLIPLTGTVTASNSNPCFGVPSGTASIALSGGSGSQNYLWSGPAGTQTAASASSLGAGINTVSVSDGLTFCNVTHTFFISQPSAFSVNITASSPSVCLGGSISFTAFTFGGIAPINYSWVGGPNTTTRTVIENSAGIYPYTLNFTDANNCSGSKTVSALFVNNPTVTATSVSICPQQTAVLLANGAISFSWNTGAMTANLSLSPTVTTEYTVTGESQGCFASATASIIVKPAPVPVIATASSVCQNDTIFLQGSGGIFYNWSGPSGFSSNAQDTFILNTLPANTGNYIIQVTAANNCTAAISTSITVHPTPLLSALGSTVCEGAPLNLFANYQNGASYLWTGPSAFSSTLQSPAIVTSNTLMSGTYSIILTSPPGCTNSAVVQSSVIVKPIASLTALSNFCIGDSVLFFGNGGASYSWLGPNSFYSLLQNPKILILTSVASGIYTLTAFSGICSDTATQLMTVNSLPVPVAQTNSKLCEKSNINLFTTTSAQTYSWTGPNNFSQQGASVIINSVSIANQGIYTLTVNDNNNCKGVDTVVVKLLKAPIASANSPTICFGETAYLNANGGHNYFWTGPANFTFTGNPAVITSASASNSGNYTVVLTGTNGCESTTTVQLTGYNYDLPIAIIKGSNKVCVGSNINLSASGGMYYQWAGPNSFTSQQNNISLKAVDSTYAGIYTLTVKNSSLCNGSTTLAVNFYKLPKALIAMDNNNLCVPFCSNFKLTANGYSLVSNNFEFTKDNINGLLASKCFTAPDSYFIKAHFTDTNNCVNTATLIINTFEKPVANFEYSPVYPVAGIDNMHFYNTSSGNEQTQWQWFFEGHTNDTVTGKSPQFIYGKSGVYPVTMIVKNKWGCADTVLKKLIVEDEFSLFVPNAFTPNGDGLNDVFLPVGQGILTFNLDIFNRWGALIFQTQDIYAGWDGTVKGEVCMSDVYTWKITCSDASQKLKSFTGRITLVK